MTPDQVAMIDAASMDILEEVGVIFRDEIALADWKRAGARGEGERVYLDRGLVRELLATIPSGWEYRARNPERSLPFGGKHSIFVPMTGAPFLRDLEDVRRWPTSTCFTSWCICRPRCIRPPITSSSRWI